MHHIWKKQIYIRKNVTVRHGDNEDRRQNQLPAIFESCKEDYFTKIIFFNVILLRIILRELFHRSMLVFSLGDAS